MRALRALSLALLRVFIRLHIGIAQARTLMKKNKNSAISGLMLAGGLAERMGSCKALLPVPRESALEVIVSRMRDSGIGSITVVTGGHDTTVRREALRLDCVTVHNPAYASGMFSRVIAGMKALPQNA